MQLLCCTSDLAKTGAKSLTINFNDRDIDIFVIKNCINGPCTGDSLKPLPLHIKNGEIYLNAAQKTE